MSTNITLNHTNRTIELSKKDYEAHCRFGTDQYHDVQEVRRDYPNYKVVMKKASAPETTSITFEQMKKYISKLPNNDNFVEEFNTLMESEAPYGKVKSWFLDTFPQYEAANAILDRIAKAKKDEKKAKAEEKKAKKLIGSTSKEADSEQAAESAA